MCHGGGDWAATTGVLASPEWREVAAATLLGRCTQWRQSSTGEWEGWHLIADRAKLTHEPVDDPPGNTPAQQVGQGGMRGLGALQCLPMHSTGGCFVAEQVGGAYLHPSCPQCQRRTHPTSIGDTTGGDDRQAH